MLSFLAQTTPGEPATWLPVLLLLLIGLGFAVVNVVASVIIGPSRTGPGKETTYESGMIPVGDTRKRFNVRFYLVAITFVVFDVEVVFMYPWAVAYPHTILGGGTAGTVLLLGMLFFVTLILVGYIYEWGKGVFRWD